jgi:hypothetical protein
MISTSYLCHRCAGDTTCRKHPPRANRVRRNRSKSSTKCHRWPGTPELPLVVVEGACLGRLTSIAFQVAPPLTETYKDALDAPVAPPATHSSPLPHATVSASPLKDPGDADQCPPASTVRNAPDSVTATHVCSSEHESPNTPACCAVEDQTAPPSVDRNKADGLAATQVDCDMHTSESM